MSLKIVHQGFLMMGKSGEKSRSVPVHTSKTLIHM
jgi:hypothetical protein